MLNYSQFSITIIQKLIKAETYEFPNSFLISKDKFLNVQDFDLCTDF